MEFYLGVDAGSISTKVVALDEKLNPAASIYLLTGGDPAGAVQTALAQLTSKLGTATFESKAVTGSARELVGDIISANLVKNEITCQGVFATHFLPGTRTVIEIGGQDSKLILLKDDLVSDFAMNTVCAAGTGSFLDHQASRFGLSIEQFSLLALQSHRPVEIAGRCTVFAESDIIHRQQCGEALPDIIYGLCRALCRNYVNDIIGSKSIEQPVLFQGGVAKNAGMIKAFEEALGITLVVPRNPELSGAIGAACLAAAGAMTHNKGRF